MATTNYYVLSVEADEDTILSSLGDAEATTGEAAIRKVVKEQGLTLDGRYVAVPVRNWTEIEFTVEERAPIVKANYLSERRAVPATPIPGQVTIEDEIEANGLAAVIEGEDLADIPLSPEPVEGEEVPA